MSHPETSPPTPQQGALQLAVQAAFSVFGAQALPSSEPQDEFEQLLNDAAIAADEPATVWPKANDVGRYGDMSQLAHLRVGLDGDNDAYVSVYDGEGGAVVEFNMPFTGGGKSPRTREALVALMVAMEMDNAEDPSRDWWLRGQLAKSPQP